MGVTLDMIETKEFKVVERGYDKTEVEDFLNDILDEMDGREQKMNALEAKVAELTAALEMAKEEAKMASAVTAAPVSNGIHATESFELVLSKAQAIYEQVVTEADAKAASIIEGAKTEATSIKTNAETEIGDLTKRLAEMRQQASDYYIASRKAIEAQIAALDQFQTLK